MNDSTAIDTTAPSLAAALACLQPRGGASTVGRLAGYGLASHFQPIFSLSHGRVVGHEALLRAHDAEGSAVPPPRFFEVDDFDELLWRDRVVHTLHAANYTRAKPASQWLFLNMHPQVFLRCAQGDDDHFLRDLLRHFDLAGPQVVFEVLEHPLQGNAEFAAAVTLMRSHGCLIALDDFGAGHSNFDRVWRLRPEIVKLDRSLVARAAVDAQARRVVVQMVSLLHECGALVVMEGVETDAEANVALEADVDMVQGWFFARAEPDLLLPDQKRPLFDALWAGAAGRWKKEHLAYRHWVARYRKGMCDAASLLIAGRGFDEAARAFMGLPDAELCYLLDSEGHQIDANLWGSPALQPSPAFEPLRNWRGACWARRPYVRRAVQKVGQVQVSRPYPSVQDSRVCVTLSIAFLVPGSGELRVLCGDVSWR